MSLLPGSAVLLGGPFVQIGADLRDQLQHSVLRVGGQPREVAPLTHLRKDVAQLADVGGVDTRALVRFARGRAATLRLIVSGLGQQRLNLAVARGDLLLVVFPALHGLAQGKQVLVRPRAAQRFFDAVRLGASNLDVAQLQQTIGTALAIENGAHHRQATDAGKTADDVMQHDVHALQRLLHVLHMASGQADVIRAQTQVIRQATDVHGRHESSAQQPVRMQRRTPLAIQHVGLAPG